MTLVAMLLGGMPMHRDSCRNLHPGLNSRGLLFVSVAYSLYYCGAPLSAILADRIFCYMRYRVCADLHVASAELFSVRQHS